MVSVIPSNSDLITPIFGISIVPSSTTGSAARGSAGTASGLGSVAGTVVVVDDDVVVELVVDVELLVDVVACVVVVVLSARTAVVVGCDRR